LSIAEDVVGGVHLFDFFLRFGDLYEALFAFARNSAMIYMIYYIVEFLQLLMSAVFLHGHWPILIIKVQLFIYVLIFKLATFYF